jgi:hypothetical protein
MPIEMAQPAGHDQEHSARQSLLDELTGLAGRLGAGDIESRLRRLQAQWRRPLRVALLGEQSTKARPINEFLGTDALPTLSAVGMDRLLVAGDSDFLEIEQGSVRRKLDLAPGSWALVDDSSGVSRVSVHLRSARLERAGVELLDVPMARRQPEPFAVLRSVQGCSAAFLLVAAASQITRWEEDVLREAFVRRFFPFLAVGVVDLGQVAADERGAVLAAIRRRVEAIDPSLEVIVEDEAPGPGGEPVIGRLLESLFSRADAPSLRQAWFDRHLAILLDDFEAFLSEKERVDALTAEDRSRELREAEQVRDESAASWLDARLELRQRQANLVEQVQREIGNLRSSALPMLRAEMNSANDVRRWVTDRMAAAIRESLVDSARLVDREIKNGVTRDSAWLLSRFPGLANQLSQAVQSLVLQEDYVRMPYTDLEVFAAADRQAGLRGAAQQAIPAIGAGLNVPVPALNLLYSLVTLTQDRNQAREEKDEVVNLLSRTFRRAASRFAEYVDEYVVSVYGQLESQAESSVQAFLTNRCKALMKQDRRSLKELSAVRTGVERIRSELRAYAGGYAERNDDHA